MAKNIKVTLTLDDSQYQRKLKSANKELKNVGGTNSTLLAGFGRLGPAIAGAFSVGVLVNFGRQIIDVQTKYQSLRNQLTLVTNGTDDLNRVMGLLTQTAVANRTSFEATTELFTKLRVATEELGVSEQDVIDVTTSLSQALQVAGADAATTNSVIRQFGQAMASGTVRGDEFNSLVEGLGPALSIMARETGINVGQLREMSRAGELSAEVMFEMLQSSNALRQSFEQMAPTIEQVKTQFDDAFDRFLISIDEALGVSDAFTAVLKAMTRELDRLSGADGALVNMNVEEIMTNVEEGSVGAVTALEELNRKMEDLSKGQSANFLSPFLGTGNYSEALNLLRELGVEVSGFGNANKEQYEEGRAIIQAYIDTLQAQIDANDKIIQQAKEDERIRKEQEEAYRELIKPFKQYIDLAEAFSKNDYRSEQEKITDRVAEATKVVEGLKKAQEETNGAIRDYEILMAAANAELAAALQAQQDYNDSLVDTGDEIETYASFMEDLKDNVGAFIQTQAFAKQAIEEITQQFEDGTLGVEEYNEMLERLNSILGITKEKAEPVKTLMQQFNDDLATARGTTEEYTALLEQLDEMYKTSAISLQTYIQLKRQLDEVFGENEAMNSFLDTVGTAQKALSTDLATALLEGQSALDSFKSFFKKIVTQIIADVIRLQVIQPILTSLFGLQFGTGGAVTGMNFAGSFFGGIFGKQAGGAVMKNRPYIVGERGPEMFVPSSSGSVVPNHDMGVTNVYNISAVDTQSFRTALLKDGGAEFLYSAVQSGSRRLPR